MTGFAKLLSPDSRGQVDPSQFSFGSGWYIGDRLILTAAHVIYTYNEANDVADRDLVTLDPPETTSVPGYERYSLYGAFQLYDYKTEFLRVAATEASSVTGPQIAGRLSVRSRDAQFVAGSDNVDSGDAGVVVFLNTPDVFASDIGLASTGDSIKLSRRGAATSNADGTVVSDTIGFKYSGLATHGDSGSALIMHFDSKEFIFGSIVSIEQEPSGPADGILFSPSQFTSLMDHLAQSQSGDVTAKEPTNLIVGSQGDDTADGSYRADIFLGRGGIDTLSDGDAPSHSAWANDQLFGGEGNDILKSGRGADLLHGGDHRSYPGVSRIPIEDDGEDTVSYADLSTTTGINLHVGGTAASSTHADNPDFALAAFVTDETSSDIDTLISIEKVKGTSQMDTLLIKDLKADLLAGSDGKGGLLEFDMGGPAESDNGDLIDFQDLEVALKVDLASNRVELKSDSAVGLRVLNAENVYGGKGEDEIIGSDQVNELRGGDGDDTLEGGEGNDRLYGGHGSDTLSGGDGIDEAIFDNGVTVWFSAATGLTVTGSQGAIDTLHSIERLTGSAGYDKILIESLSPGAMNALEWIDLGANHPSSHDGLVFHAVTENVKVDLSAGRFELISGGAGFNFRNIEDVSAGKGDDVIIGDDAGNVLGGGDGNNEIHGGAGNDTLGGGPWGVDKLWGGSGSDRFNVTGGDIIHDIDAEDSVMFYASRLTGGPAIGSNPGQQRYFQNNDSEALVLYWNPGSTTLKVQGVTGGLLTIFDFQNGDGGIFLGSGTFGSAGDDSLAGGDGDDEMSSLDGDDTLAGGAGDDMLDGGNGNDTFLAGPGQGLDLIFGGHGSDTLAATAVSTVIGLRGISGVETITANGFADVSIRTSDFNDHYDFGGITLAGITRIDAAGGDDTLIGNDQANMLLGGSGSDILAGGPGDDTLSDDYGDDSYHYALGDGSDVIDEWDGYDVLMLGAGITAANVGVSLVDQDVIFSFADGGQVLVYAGERAEYAVDEIRFEDGAVWSHAQILARAGTAGDDDITGTSGGDTIGGLAGADLIHGAEGDDVLDGGAGDDFLDGGAGADRLKGGTGNDLYVVDDAGDLVEEDAGAGTDEVRTALAVYSLATRPDVENLTGTSAARQTLTGNAADNVFTAGPADDIVHLWAGGSDTILAGAGNDSIFFGSTLTGADILQGGAGIDTLIVQGPYGSLTLTANIAQIENVSILAGSNTAFGEPGTNRHDYVLTTHDANFAAGVQARINAAALLEGEDFTFNGSAETDASYVVYGGKGKDTLLGGLGNDIFFYAEERFASGDTVNGGAGYDGMFLRGNYTIDFNAPGYTGLFTNIENLTLTSATDERYARGGGTEFDYNLTLSDAIVKPGETLTVSGSLLQLNETMVLDGSAETDGFLRLFGGLAADTLKGGANADLLHGAFGADILAGGGGADVFRYQAVTESYSVARDHIVDFTPGTDRIELDRIDASRALAGDQAFTWIGSGAFSNTAGELRAFQSGAQWIVQGDINGDGHADLIIALTLQGPTPLGAGDFVL